MKWKFSLLILVIISFNEVGAQKIESTYDSFIYDGKKYKRGDLKEIMIDDHQAFVEYKRFKSSSEVANKMLAASGVMITIGLSSFYIGSKGESLSGTPLFFGSLSMVVGGLTLVGGISYGIKSTYKLHKSIKLYNKNKDSISDVPLLQLGVQDNGVGVAFIF